MSSAPAGDTPLPPAAAVAHVAAARRQKAEARRQSRFRRCVRRCFPRSKAMFLFAAYCYAFTLDTLVSRAVLMLGFWATAADTTTGETRYIDPGIDGSSVAELLLFAPVLETLLLAGIIHGAARLGAGVLLQVCTASLVIAALHAYPYPFHALIVVAAFFIQAIVYTYWRELTSVWTAAGMLFVLHAALNLVPVLRLLTGL